MTESDLKAFDGYFDQLIQLSDQMSYVSYDLSTIDGYVADLIKLVTQAKREGCSARAIRRCIAGITFGLREARAELPIHVTEEEGKVFRENQMSGYVQACIQTMLYDRTQAKLDNMVEEKKAAEARYEEALKEADDFIKKHPSIWIKIKDMTDDERTRLTGDERVLASKLKLSINRQKDVIRKGQMIGELSDNLVTVENNCSALLDTLKNWETSIAAYDVDEINRLTDEFMARTIEQQQNMETLERTTERVNAMFEELFGNKKVKDDIISTFDQYEAMLEGIAVQKAQDAEGRRLYEEHEAARQKEAEKQMQEQMDAMLEDEEENDTYTW